MLELDPDVPLVAEPVVELPVVEPVAPELPLDGSSRPRISTS
jgi:hypothetical protein